MACLGNSGKYLANVWIGKRFLKFRNKGRNHTIDSFDYIRLTCKIKRQVTNWEKFTKQYDKELIFFIYNDSSNKKTTNASKEKWAKDVTKILQ